MYQEIIRFIRDTFDIQEEFIPLHEPRFWGNEKEYLNLCIDSTFVSSVGEYVNRFEAQMREYTGASYAVATTNGTLALHIALLLSGVKRDDLVITQPLTFIATCNAIAYLGADPLFVDIDKARLGLSAEKLDDFLKKETTLNSKGECIHSRSGKRIAACVPMHTFGHPVEIDAIAAICNQHQIPLVEDAAESIGSNYKGKHTGRFGLAGIFSFNGNKTITCGGGGMIITDDEAFGKMAKHLTTQAKIPHPWNFEHDHIGYNYRLPNINAALACAQMEQLDSFIEAKRKLALSYKNFFENTPITFVAEPSDSFSNYWLNCILLPDREQREAFLAETNSKGVMTRPAWTLMNKLRMFEHCICSNIDNALYIEDRLVNVPSSVIKG
jgi:perosamine synthetase